MTWAVGARTDVYRDDPNRTDRDELLVNVLSAVLDTLREYREPADAGR